MSALGPLVIERNEQHVRVDISNWAQAVEASRTDGFTYFSFLSGIDWLPNPDLGGEHHYDTTRESSPQQEIIVDNVIRLAGGTSRYSVMTRLQNLESNASVTLAADIGEDLRVPTITHLFAGAEWHERETWEMYGFIFDGHPNLKHLYLPDEFEGFPLRKDFPLTSRLVRPWPGLVDMEEMPGKDEPEQDFA